jgi:hypothetical protein
MDTPLVGVDGGIAGNPATDRDDAPDPVRVDAVGAVDVRAISLVSGLGRMAIGIGLAVAPRQALTALGFRSVSDEAVVVSRIAGGRDFVLGALTLLAIDDPDRLRTAHLACAAVDAGDAAAFGAALAQGGDLRDAGIRGLAAAIPAAIAGIWAARRLSG